MWAAEVSLHKPVLSIGIFQHQKNSKRESNEVWGSCVVWQKTRTSTRHTAPAQVPMLTEWEDNANKASPGLIQIATSTFQHLNTREKDKEQGVPIFRLLSLCLLVRMQNIKDQPCITVSSPTVKRQLRELRDAFPLHSAVKHAHGKLLRPDASECSQVWSLAPVFSQQTWNSYLFSKSK